MLVLFLQELPQIPSWVQYVNYGQTVLILALLAAWSLRALPHWKEVRLRDADVRSEDNVIKREMAVSLGRLAEALKEIAVEQRRATENIEISQRVAADTSERVSNSVAVVHHRMDEIEQKLAKIPFAEFKEATA